MKNWRVTEEGAQRSKGMKLGKAVVVVAGTAFSGARRGSARSPACQRGLTGTMRDASAVVIPGARFDIQSLAAGVSSVAVTTNETGGYQSPPLIPGGYRVTARRAGFKHVVTTVTLEVEQRRALELAAGAGIGSRRHLGGDHRGGENAHFTGTSSIRLPGGFTRGLQPVDSERLPPGQPCEELENGPTCAGAPVWNYTNTVIAATSVTGPTVKMTKDCMPALVNCLVNATAGLSTAPGHRQALIANDAGAAGQQPAG